MYDWSFAGSTRAGEQRAASVLDDPRVVPGRQPRRTGAPREREQLARSGSRRCSACTGSASRRARSRATNGCDDRARGTPRAGRASRAAGRARGTSRARRSPPPASSTHARRRAPRGRSRAGVSRRSPPGPARSRATALSTPPLIATATAPANGGGREDGPERVRERVDGQRLAADGGRLEQRQAARAARRARRRRRRRSGRRRRAAARTPSRRRASQSPATSITAEVSASASTGSRAPPCR